MKLSPRHPFVRRVSLSEHSSPAAASHEGARTGKRLWQARWCYAFMAPALGLTALFTLYPIVASLYFSLLNWSGFSPGTFVGLANYPQVIADHFFWDAFGRSFLFLLANVPVRLALALLLAILLNDRALRFSAVFRTFFFIPVVTSDAIVGIVMVFVLSPFNGPINRALLDLHLIQQPIDFLGDPQTAFWSVVAVSIWKWLGVPLIYWLAGLQTIPQQLYDAARVDGAGWWQTHRHITLPLLMPFAAVITLITATGTLHVFSLAQTMTAGGPYFASEVVEVYIYRTAFGSGLPQFGYASAAAVFFGVAVMFMALLQFRVGARMRALQRELEPGAA